jgi:hypothetical protein
VPFEFEFRNSLISAGLFIWFGANRSCLHGEHREARLPGG